MPATEPRIVYTLRPDATPEGELNVLANVYRFILDCNAKKLAPEPDGHDDQEMSRSEGGQHDLTSDVATDWPETEGASQDKKGTNR